MTVPRHTSDLLMLPPSFSLSPCAPVALALSLQRAGGALSGEVTGLTPAYLPARSTRWSLERVSLGRPHSKSA